MVLGKYPIPPPDSKEIEKIIGMDPRSLAASSMMAAHLPPGVRPPSGYNDISAKPMAIFELLDYIVNEVDANAF